MFTWNSRKPTGSRIHHDLNPHLIRIAFYSSYIKIYRNRGESGEINQVRIDRSMQDVSCIVPDLGGSRQKHRTIAKMTFTGCGGGWAVSTAAVTWENPKV